MLIIKNAEELAKLVDENKNLMTDDDVRIEYQLRSGELENVNCRDLFLGNDKAHFDFVGNNFNGRNFYGRNFTGNDFYGRNFNGHSFIGHDFDGNNFNGYSFFGKKISYDAFFNCYGLIRCVSIVSRRALHAEPIALGGQIEFVKE